MDAQFEVEEAQATFRGVPFHVTKRSRGGGRRGPTHEMPQRDEPDGEDLGRKFRSFKVEAVLVGDDHTAQALRLLRALEDVSGPGIYRDPWHGEWSVICRTVEAVDDVARQGVSAFQIQFEESAATRYPLAGRDTAALVDLAADELSLASVADFGRRFSLADAPAYLADAADAVVDDALSALADMGLPPLGLDSAYGVLDAADSVARFRAGLPGNLYSGLGGRLASLFRAHGGGSYSRLGRVGDHAAARRGFAGLSGFGSGYAAIPRSTPFRARQADNQAALVALVRRQAVAEEARAMAAGSWDSWDAAMADRAATLDRLRALKVEAGGLGDDASFRALGGLTHAVTRDVYERALPLPRLRRVELVAPVPAHVAAYRLTGDARKADDLVARNRVAHPLAVPAGRVLEVLDG